MPQGEISAVTVRQLLAHTGGLPRDMALNAWENLSLIELAARAGAARLTAPGARYRYSNLGYILLGRIVEIVSGDALDNYVNTRILAPAGMRDTGYILGRSIVERLATPYRIGREGIEFADRGRELGLYPPGGLYSTIDDLDRFILALEVDVLLASPEREQMVERHVRISERGEEWSGFGWTLREQDGARLRIMAGSADGAKSVVLREPEPGVTIIILSNFGDTPIADMLRDVFAVVRGREPRPLTLCDTNADEFADMVGAYDFSGTPLAARLGVAHLDWSLVRNRGRLFLWDSSSGEASLLCPRQGGGLQLSFTSEAALFPERTPGAPPALRLEWGDLVARAARE